MKGGKTNAREKELIRRAIILRKSYNFWGQALVTKYLRHLKTIVDDVIISANQSEIESRIYSWIEIGDPRLEVFNKVNQQAEAEKARTAQIMSIPAGVRSKIERVIRVIEEIPYDPVGAGPWGDPKIVYVKRNESIVEIWLGKNRKR
ncbi:MAG: hypothetical protein EPN93_17375 [Spirochaetes bacterium]|nr:MAG: hypothetical protein EPN93_17375 [Spirochaetota bacterium]